MWPPGPSQPLLHLPSSCQATRPPPSVPHLHFLNAPRDPSARPLGLSCTLLAPKSLQLCLDGILLSWETHQAGFPHSAGTACLLGEFQLSAFYFQGRPLSNSRGETSVETALRKPVAPHTVLAVPSPLCRHSGSQAGARGFGASFAPIDFLHRSG